MDMKPGKQYALFSLVSLLLLAVGLLMMQETGARAPGIYLVGAGVFTVTFTLRRTIRAVRKKPK